MKIKNMTLHNFYASKTRSNSPLHRAIIEFEDLNTIERLLKEGANIHVKNHENYKPLDLAIQNDNTQVALLLIRRGALAGEDLNELLLTVMEMNNATIFKIILDYGIKLYPLIDLENLFIVAILQRQPKVIQHILPHIQFFKPSDKYIPREAVINSGPQCEECLQVLLKWNFIVSPYSNYDEEFIFGAIKNGYLPIVIQLIENEIDVNMVNSDTGLNLLKVACIYKQHEIVEILLKNSACTDETIPTRSGALLHQEYYKCVYSYSTIKESNYLREIACLHIAVFNSDSKTLKFLLKYGAKIIDDPTFFNITCIAVRINCKEIVRIFLDHGVDVNYIDSEEETLLHSCICGNYGTRDDRYDIAEMLLKRGATKLIQTPYNTLLFQVIENGHHRIAQLFLDYDADVQAVNLNGDNLLHKAIENKVDIEFIENLLKRNVPVNATNNDLHTPLHIACRLFCNDTSKVKEYIKTLLNYDANINCVDHGLMTPLHFACYLQKPEIITVLLENGANPNAKNNDGHTSLHIVCKHENDEEILCRFIDDKSPNIVELLLKYNADIKAIDVNGWSPFRLACETKSTRAIKALRKLQTLY